MRILGNTADILFACNKHIIHKGGKDMVDASVIFHEQHHKIVIAKEDFPHSRSNDFRKVEISVFGAENHSPHFHIDSLDNNTHTAIRLTRPDYFLHNRLLFRYTNSVLSKVQSKFLYELMNTKYGGKTLWEIACDTWDSDRANYQKVDGLIEIPDYRKLPTRFDW